MSITSSLVSFVFAVLVLSQVKHSSAIPTPTPTTLNISPPTSTPSETRRICNFPSAPTTGCHVGQWDLHIGLCEWHCLLPDLTTTMTSMWTTSSPHDSPTETSTLSLTSLTTTTSAPLSNTVCPNSSRPNLCKHPSLSFWDPTTCEHICFSPITSTLRSCDSIPDEPLISCPEGRWTFVFHTCRWKCFPGVTRITLCTTLKRTTSSRTIFTLPTSRTRTTTRSIGFPPFTPSIVWSPTTKIRWSTIRTKFDTLPTHITRPIEVIDPVPTDLTKPDLNFDPDIEISTPLDFKLDLAGVREIQPAKRRALLSEYEKHRIIKYRGEYRRTKHQQPRSENEKRTTPIDGCARPQPLLGCDQPNQWQCSPLTNTWQCTEYCSLPWVDCLPPDEVPLPTPVGCSASQPVGGCKAPYKYYCSTLTNTWVCTEFCNLPDVDCVDPSERPERVTPLPSIPDNDPLVDSVWPPRNHPEGSVTPLPDFNPEVDPGRKPFKGKVKPSLNSSHKFLPKKRSGRPVLKELVPIPDRLTHTSDELTPTTDELTPTPGELTAIPNGLTPAPESFADNGCAGKKRVGSCRWPRKWVCDGMGGVEGWRCTDFCEVGWVDCL